MRTDLEWRPSATVGAVKNNANEYNFFPLKLPNTPEYAKDKAVVELGDKIMKEILSRSDKGALVDPWARRYEWRKHPYFSNVNKVKLLFPGLGIATLAFGGYLFLEAIGVIPSKQHH